MMQLVIKGERDRQICGWSDVAFKFKSDVVWNIRSFAIDLIFVTPPRNRGGVIFSLQSVCVSVCLCVCVCLSVCVSGFLVNKIPAERMNRFRRGFR